MSGRAIFKPEPRHRCAPGWTRVPVGPDSPLRDLNIIETLRPPFSGEFPVGCRWQCDDCGQVWIRRRAPRQYPNGGQFVIGGIIRWRKERWWERRR